MEEQPIDDLFRRKLREASIEPSHTAWATLQSRQGKSRMVPLWTYWAVAASLVLVGSLGWWALLPQDGVKNGTLVVKGVKLAPEVAAPRSGEKWAVTDESQAAQRPAPEQDLIVRRAKKEATRNKSNTGRLTILEDQALVVQQLTLRTDKTGEVLSDLKGESAEPTQAKSVAKDTPNEIPVASTERTLVVSIAQPAPSALGPTTPEMRGVADSSTGKGVFGHLLRKVKKLKDGEVFALSTSGPGKTPRRGLAKMYEEVKESIKNNSAD